MILFIRATSPDELGVVEKNNCCCNNNINSSSSISSLHTMSLDKILYDIGLI
ncbi:MAG TPA: hypothetical protein VKA95_04000 [Nitrososphaeraceae archaeon]|nr:hypothetical protein [Nitrososphaeraceae archaeon]